MREKNNNWFTIEAIDKNTYAISEYGHWEQVHCYLFSGTESAVLIDTGTGIGNISEPVKSLTSLPVQVVTTHCHWDHTGGHAHFSDVAIHKDDATWLENGIPLSPEFVIKMLMKEPFTIPAPADFSPETYRVFTGKANRLLEDGDIIELGSRHLNIIHTPGHSPGHICIYEEEKGYLATGDILYEGTIYANYPSTDPVALERSLQKLARLPEIKRLLPGHNRLDIPVSYLAQACSLCEKIEQVGLLKHGSGLHCGNGINLLF